MLEEGFERKSKHPGPDIQAGFRKDRGTRDQIANIHWIIEKNKRIPEKPVSGKTRIWTQEFYFHSLL